MRLRKRRLRWPVLVAAAVVLAGGGTAYAVGRGEDGPSYRTTTATRGDVEETLTTNGLVDAARRSDLSFGTDGTVDQVKVAVGDRVTAGQVVATLETTELDAAVTEAKASLAQAIAQLEADQEAQTSAVQNAGDQEQNGSKPGGSSDTPSDGSSAALVKALQAQQKAVLEAQSKASAAIAAAKSALATQTEVCADAYGGSEPPDAPSAEATETPGAAEEPDPENAACDTALAEVQARQDTVKEAQDELAKALDALAATLSKALGSVSGDQGGTGGPSSARTAADVDSSTPETSTDGSSNGSTVTAARLAADQAQIDQARADLITAKAERALATLRSTRTGRVVALDVAQGDDASAGTTVMTIVGGDAVTLTATVGETQVDQVKVGQVVRVSVPGQTETTEGRVTAVSLVADTSTGSTSYPVTVTVEDPQIALPAGSRAQLAIVLATAEDVVTLPTSAVSGTTENARVQVWDGKKLTNKQVRVGAVGARSVEIADGVTAGTQVVLADYDEAISGASDELNQRGGFGPGGNMPMVEFRNGGGNGPMTFIAPGGK